MVVGLDEDKGEGKGEGEGVIVMCASRTVKGKQKIAAGSNNLVGFAGSRLVVVRRCCRAWRVC